MTPEAHEALEARVRTILVEQLGVEESEVTSDASLPEDLGADSLDMVEIVMALEEIFDVEIPDEDAGEIETVAEVVAYMAGRVPNYSAA